MAEKFGKRHSDVLRAIDGLEAPSEFTERNFAPSRYQDTTGRALPLVEMTRDGFMFLAMGFTGREAAAWKVKFLEAFSSMEKHIAEALTIADQMAPIIEGFRASAQATARLETGQLEIREEVKEVKGKVIDLTYRFESIKPRREFNKATRARVRQAIAKHFACKCPFCRIQQIVDENANPLPSLQYDHYDGDRSNNRDTNCVPACTKCHTLKTNDRLFAYQFRAAFDEFQRVLAMVPWRKQSGNQNRLQRKTAKCSKTLGLFK